MGTNSQAHADVIKATLIGILAVFIWGPALPIVKLVSSRIGPIGYIGITSSISGLLGVIKNILGKKKILTFKVLKHPIFYLRWVCFVVNYGLATIAVNLVSKENLPLVILLNYTWPTMVILLSIALSLPPASHTVGLLFWDH